MKRTILIIDDDPLVLKTFKRLLEHYVYEVITATGYEEAVAAINEKQFDLILSDIRMPGKNGVETVSSIQSSLIEAGKKDLPIIFITGYADLGQELNANFLGEILKKPVDNDHLLATINKQHVVMV